MSQEIIAVLDYMEKEKGIKREVMLAAMESALLTAARKSVGPAQDLRIQIDPRSAKIRAIASLKVVEKVRNAHAEISLPKAQESKKGARMGELVEVEVTPKDFGRIAAQVFKQTINQNLRSIERGMIFNEFKDRVGTIVAGTVRRFDKSDVIVDLGKFEAVMPTKERPATEQYSPGERIRAYVVEVQNTLRGPEIILSRSHPDFVRKLFELEVGELNDKSVEIKALAREPGYRTKMAVWSDNEKIDPVGACVGIRGSRVKNIVRELNNEKIDLFRWSPNIRELAVEALKPAKLKSIDVDEATHHIKATVDEENLSLAIGKRGQNARLASKLLGWEIDVIKEEIVTEGFEQKSIKAATALADALGIDRPLAEKICQVGFSSLEVLVEAEDTDLISALPDVTPETLKGIRAKAIEITHKNETPAS